MPNFTFVKDSFPTPVAERFAVMTSGPYGAGTFNAGIDALEALIHVLTALAVGIHDQSATLPSISGPLSSFFEKPKLTLGDRVGLLREATRQLDPTSGPVPERLRRFMWKEDGHASKQQKALARLVELRNRHQGHGSRRDDAAAAGEMPALVRDLGVLVEGLQWVTGCRVWVPLQVGCNGEIETATEFQGGSRTYTVDVRALGIRLMAKDSGADGTVDVKRTPILVNLESRDVVPLSPFASSDTAGLCFLDGIKTHQGAVTGVAFRSYSAQKERAPDVVPYSTQSFEGHQVRRLFAATQPPVAIIATSAYGVGCASTWVEQETHISGFVGRSTETQHLATWAADAKKSGYRVVLGPPGQGKSALMARLSADLGCVRPGSVEGLLRGTEAEAGALPGVVLHHVKAAKDPQTILRSLLAQACVLAGLECVDAPEGLEVLRERLVEALSRIKGGAVMIVDALDELDGVDLTFLPSRLPPGVRGVVSCRPGVSLLDALRARVSPLSEVTLEPLHRSDFDALLTAQVEADVAAELAATVDLHAVYGRTRGTPLLVREAVRVLKEAHISGELSGVEVRIPQTLDAVFRRQVREATTGGDSSVRVLGALACARAPLSKRAVHSVLHDSGASFTDVGHALEALSEVLVSDGTLYQLYHLALAEYVRREVLGPDVAEVHRRLAELADPAEEAGPYRRLHRAWHLLEAAREAGARDLASSQEALRFELTSWASLCSAAEHGILHARGQAILAALTVLSGAECDEVDAWGEFARAEAGRCTNAGALTQQALLREPDHPVRRAADEAQVERPLLIPEVQPSAAVAAGRLVLGVGGAVTSIKAFQDGFVAFREHDAWAFDWTGQAAAVPREAFGTLLEGVDMAVKTGEGCYKICQCPSVRAALERDIGPDQGDGAPKPVAGIASSHVAIASHDAIRVHALEGDDVISEIPVDVLFERTRDEIGLGRPQGRRSNVLSVRLPFNGAPQIAALAGGAHLVVWSVAYTRSHTRVAHYAVWAWEADAVVWRFEIEMGSVFKGGRRDAEEWHAEPLVLGGDHPRFTFRIPQNGRVTVYDAASAESWPVGDGTTESVRFEGETVHVQRGKAGAIQFASSDGRYLYCDRGYTWDVESGEHIATVVSGTPIGTNADGSRVLWDAVKRDETHEQQWPEPTRHVLRVTRADGQDVRRIDAASSSGTTQEGDATWVTRDLATVPAALGVADVALALPDGSVRIVALHGATEPRAASGETRRWFTEDAPLGVLTSSTAVGEVVDWEWRLLSTGEEGVDVIRDRYYAPHKLFFDLEDAASTPGGDLLGWGGHHEVDGDPVCFAVYGLREEFGLAEVRRENLRTGVAEPLGRFSYADHDPRLAEAMASPDHDRGALIQDYHARIEFVPLGGSGVAVVVRDAYQPVIGLSGGTVYVASRDGNIPGHQAEFLHSVLATAGGEFILVDGTETLFTQVVDGWGQEYPMRVEFPRVAVLDARTGVEVHRYERDIDAPGRLHAVEGDVAVLSVDDRLVAWDWVSNRVVAETRLTGPTEVACCRVSEPGAVVLVRAGRDAPVVVDRWRWSEPVGVSRVGEIRGLPDGPLLCSAGTGSVLAVARKDCLAAIHLETGRVASVWMQGDVRPAVWRDRVIATDARGLYQFRSSFS